MTESVTDNEWAAGVMGWTLKEEPRRAGHYWQTPSGPRPIKWNPDTDANDFRDLLNCEAVREWAEGKRIDMDGGITLRRAFWYDCLSDQPAALRQLREAMEGKS